MTHSAISVKVYFTFSRSWRLTIRLFSVILGHSLEKSHLSAEMQSVYSTTLADWASLEESYPSEEIQSVYSITPADWASLGEVLLLCSVAVSIFYCTRSHVGGVLPLCRDSVYVFYSLSRLVHSLGEVLPLSRDVVGVFYSPI